MPDLPDLRDRLWPRSQSPARILDQHLPRNVRSALATVQHRTIVRTAVVQGEGTVQGTKLHEVDHLSRQAMTGQAMLARWRDVLAAGDPFLSDELRFFTDVARLGKGEIIADTIDSYCKESRS
jgi:hypothetical protein